MISPHEATYPVALSGAVYLVRPTGARAETLDDLLRELAVAEPRVLFYHTQMPRLRPAGRDDVAIDDISAWLRGVVQDQETAERVAFALESTERTVHQLRHALVSVLDAVPARSRVRRAAPEGGALVLFTFETVEIPDLVHAADPTQLMERLTTADTSVWFHNLVEEPWLDPESAVLDRWLRDAGATRLADLCAREAGGSQAIERVRQRVLRQWRRWQLGRRIIEASTAADDERRAAARAAAAGLARRLTTRNPGT